MLLRYFVHPACSRGLLILWRVPVSFIRGLTDLARGLPIVCESWLLFNAFVFFYRLPGRLTTRASPVHTWLGDTLL